MADRRLLADAFAVFKSVGLSIDLVSTSETNVTVSSLTRLQTPPIPRP